MYYELMRSLHLLKLFHDIGIYDKAVAGIRDISGDDYYELVLLGLEHVAPYFEREELGEEHCCGGHVVYHFSDLAMLEYYRLCRLYEFMHGIPPEKNPYVIDANNYYSRCYFSTYGDFATNYDDEEHPRGIWVETCPEQYISEHDVIELIHEVLEYYRKGLDRLSAELSEGPPVWLPALPPHVGPPGCESSLERLDINESELMINEHTI